MTSYEFDWSRFASIANVASAIGLLIFGGVQVWLTKANERTRIRERDIDQAAKIDAAHGAIWAEYNRIFGVRSRWEERDLVAAAFAGDIDPDEILPRDWGQATALLGQLGQTPAEFGGVAFTVAYDVKHDLERFIKACHAAGPAGNTLEQQVHMALTYSPRLREWEARLKASFEEIDNLLLDALEHIPGAQTPRPRQFNESMNSKHGRALLDELKGRQNGPEG